MRALVSLPDRGLRGFIVLTLNQDRVIHVSLELNRIPLRDERRRLYRLIVAIAERFAGSYAIRKA